MDAMFVDQHFLRSPLRLYSEVDAENNNSLFSAAMMEKARAHLSLWGRTAGAAPYPSAELHALLLNGGSAPPPMWANSNRSALPPLPLPAHLWAGGGGSGPGGGQAWAGGLLTPPTSSSSSSGSPSPSSELRLPRPVFPQRFSPYPLAGGGRKQPSPPAAPQWTT